MNKLLRTLLAITILGGMAWFMWTFKWWIIGGAVVLTIVDYVIGYIYKKRTGTMVLPIQNFIKKGNR